MRFPRGTAVDDNDGPDPDRDYCEPALTAGRSEIEMRLSSAAHRWARQDALDHRDPQTEMGLAFDAMNAIRANTLRIAELEAALREARGMLRSCALDEPDEAIQESWNRSLEKIDAALKVSP